MNPTNCFQKFVTPGRLLTGAMLFAIMCQLPQLSAQTTNPTLPPVNHNDLFTKPASVPKPATTDRAPMTSYAGDFVSTPPVEQQLHLIVGRSVFVNTRHRMTRVYVTSPSILDSYTASPNQLVITAKKPGSGSLIVWDESGESQAYMVNSDVNVNELRDALGKALPNGSVQVTGQEGKIVLSGTAGTEKESEAAAKMAGLYSKEVTNALVVNPSSVKQVTLKVRVVEVDRSKLNAFAVNLFKATGNTVAQSTTGQSASSLNYTAPSATAPASVSFTNPLNFALFNFGHGIGTTIQDLETMNILQILAEPNITAMSGEKGSFLAGGEFPFPVVQNGASGGTSVSIVFKPYGVKLEFTPTVNADGTITLKVAPEVSSLDYTNAVTIAGYTIPALSTRKTDTQVVLRSGETFLMSGLLDKRTTDQYAATPGIANIPILGQLFKSKNVNHSTQELAIIVTPTIVDPLTDTGFPDEPKQPVPFLDPHKFDKAAPYQKPKAK